VPRSLIPHTVLHGRSSSTLRFYLGDCRDLLARLDASSLHIVITSPPYNLGVAYRSYDDRRPREDYLRWTSEWVESVRRALVPLGSLFLNVGSKPTDPWTALDIAQAVRPHLRLQNVLHWIKSIAVERDAAGAGAGLDRDVAIGHYKPINSRRFVNDCHEFIFHFTPGGDVPLDRLALGVPYQDESNVARWRAAGGGIRCRGNTWFLPYDTIQSRDRDRPHPATFPARLPEFCLRLHGLTPGLVAADPFLGLGGTAVACAALGVDFIGIELDEGYLAEAVARTQAVLETPAPRRAATGASRRRRG
jgi:site-specific DNA-methyltransferase (adenine-specific)